MNSHYIVKEFKTNNDFAEWHDNNARYTISMITCHHPVIICVFVLNINAETYAPVSCTDAYFEESSNPYARKDTFDYITEYHFEDITRQDDNRLRKENLNQVFNMIEVSNEII